MSEKRFITLASLGSLRTGIAHCCLLEWESGSSCQQILHKPAAMLAVGGNHALEERPESIQQFKECPSLGTRSHPKGSQSPKVFQ